MVERRRTFSWNRKPSTGEDSSLGVAYKKDIDDLRDSPALIVFEELAAGAEVVYYDNPSFVEKTERCFISGEAGTGSGGSPIWC